jgi:hypothetical protein
MSIISPSEWNKLDHTEQERRYKTFVQHLESLPSQFPIDIKYLVELSEHYQTPVPKMHGCGVDWGEYA